MSDDEDLEPSLTRVELTRRLAELDRLAPPRELDERVLANARAAIGAPAPTSFYRSPRWTLAFALVATIVIGCALLLVVRGTAAHRVALGSTVAQPPGTGTAQASGATQSTASSGSGAANERRTQHGSQ
jgi:hypothetical protein